MIVSGRNANRFRLCRWCVGTSFRPLSLEVPQPLFPVAGYPVIYHHIEAASQVLMFA